MTEPRKILVLGGANSGKTGFALKLAAGLGRPRTYVATATALDEEMERKIARHREERHIESGWETVEEPVQVYDALAGHGGEGVALVDCLTLWLTNLVGLGRTDETIAHDVERLVTAIENSGASVIAVSNELGLGVVPEHEAARRFRELSGRVNQRIGSVVDEIYLVVAGHGLRIK